MTGSPRLLLIYKGHFSADTIRRLRECLPEAIASGKPLVFQDGPDVYQLLDGRWVPIDPRVTPATPEVLARDGITDDTGTVAGS